MSKLVLWLNNIRALISRIGTSDLLGIKILLEIPLNHIDVFWVSHIIICKLLFENAAEAFPQKLCVLPKITLLGSLLWLNCIITWMEGAIYLPNNPP